MKSLSLVSTVAAAALALLVAAPALAADKKKAKKASEPTTNVIAAINGNTVDIAMGTTTKTLKVTQFTEVPLNGQKGSPADLRPGMVVTEFVLGADPSVASRINASGAAAPVETATPEKKKRTKKKKEEDEE